MIALPEFLMWIAVIAFCVTAFFVLAPHDNER